MSAEAQLACWCSLSVCSEPGRVGLGDSAVKETHSCPHKVAMAAGVTNTCYEVSDTAQRLREGD